MRPSLRTKNVDFTKLWNALKNDILTIISDPSTAKPKYDWETLHRFVYRICTCNCEDVPVVANMPFMPSQIEGLQPQPHTLYHLLKETLKEHVTSRVHLFQHSNGMNEELLANYLKLWNNYYLGIEVVHRIFHYMNRDWIGKYSAAPDSKLSSPTSSRANLSVPEVYDIRTLGYLIWREHFFLQVRQHIIEAVLVLIERDRRGGSIDYALIKHVLDCLVTLGLDSKAPMWFYGRHFEIDFLDETGSFYQIESSEFLANNTVSEFLKKLEKRLEEEQKRVLLYLNSHTEKKLIRKFYEVCIDNRMDVLLSAVVSWIEQEQKEDLNRLYRLLWRSEGGINALKQAFEDQVNAAGREAIAKIASEAEKDPKLFVETLLSVYTKYRHLVVDAFSQDGQFVQALEKGCKRFINSNSLSETDASSKSAELLAKYCHLLLRPSSKASKGLSDVDLEKTISTVIVIFNFVQDKDVFQKFYSTMLARRLIQGTYVADLEQNMISKLKEVSGYENVYKYQRMFTDLNLSSDLNRSFMSTADAKSLGYDFSVMILTSGSWPLSMAPTQFSLPTELEKGFMQFEHFYKSRHSGRKLMLLHQLSYGSLVNASSLFVGNKIYDFQVTTYQLAVLLLFNTDINNKASPSSSSSTTATTTNGTLDESDTSTIASTTTATTATASDSDSGSTSNYAAATTNDKSSSTVDKLQQRLGDSSQLYYTLEQIQAATQLNTPELQFTLQVLVKSKILNADTPHFTKTTKFSINSQYKSNHRKVPLNNAIFKEKTKDDAHTYKLVNDDRKYAIQAAIVRIMKSRKTIEHQLLISEVISQLQARFKPSVSDIKKNIDVIIEKEYMERDPDNKQMYNYLA